jgi:hypothetical protein
MSDALIVFEYMTHAGSSLPHTCMPVPSTPSSVRRARAIPWRVKWSGRAGGEASTKGYGFDRSLRHDTGELDLVSAMSMARTGTGVREKERRKQRRMKRKSVLLGRSLD